MGTSETSDMVADGGVGASVNWGTVELVVGSGGGTILLEVVAGEDSGDGIVLSEVELAVDSGDGAMLLGEVADQGSGGAV
jgi:hypothetical protein